MEKQIEKLLTVLMRKVVDGIPDGKGGFLEAPIEVEAKRYLEDCGGELDAALSAAAHYIFVRKPNWSRSVWRGALLVVVGQIPLVGTPAAVFCSQFESLWRQLRFAALAAIVYGHDVRDDATQCQIILCLLDDKIQKKSDPDALKKMYRGGMKSGIQVAATIIARHVIIRGSSGFIMQRVLGGLLIGVVPEAVGKVYTVLWQGGAQSHAETAKRATEIVARAKKHFKTEDRPSPKYAFLAFLVWFLPVLVLNVANLWNVLGNAISKCVGLIPNHVWTAVASRSTMIFSQEMLNIMEAYACVLAGLLKVSTVVVLLWTVSRLCVSQARRQPWLVPTTALGVRAFLKLLSAKTIALSLCLALTGTLPSESLYHTHRAGAGLFSIAARHMPSLKPYTPYVLASLLSWIAVNAGVCLVVYVKALLPLVLDSQESSVTAALLEIATVHEDLALTGFAWARLKDAINVTSSTALFVLLEEIRKPDLVMTILGPKKVVDGLLYTAKSLGHMVASPDSVLFWLDRTTPPLAVSWLLLLMHFCATGLGMMWGFGLFTQVLSVLQLCLLSGCILLVAFVLLRRRNLPPPHEDIVWQEALAARHRLLFLVPELDSGFRNRLCFAIRFFERYDSAVSQWVFLGHSKNGVEQTLVDDDCAKTTTPSTWRRWFSEKASRPSEDEVEEEERKVSFAQRWLSSSKSESFVLCTVCEQVQLNCVCSTSTKTSSTNSQALSQEQQSTWSFRALVWRSQTAPVESSSPSESSSSLELVEEDSKSYYQRWFHSSPTSDPKDQAKAEEVCYSTDQDDSPRRIWSWFSSSKEHKVAQDVPTQESGEEQEQEQTSLWSRWFVMKNRQAVEPTDQNVEDVSFFQRWFSRGAHHQTSPGINEGEDAVQGMKDAEGVKKRRWFMWNADTAVATTTAIEAIEEEEEEKEENQPGNNEESRSSNEGQASFLQWWFRDRNLQSIEAETKEAHTTTTPEEEISQTDQAENNEGNEKLDEVNGQHVQFNEEREKESLSEAGNNQEQNGYRVHTEKKEEEKEASLLQRWFSRRVPKDQTADNQDSSETSSSSIEGKLNGESIQLAGAEYNERDEKIEEENGHPVYTEKKEGENEASLLQRWFSRRVPEDQTADNQDSSETSSLTTKTQGKEVKEETLQPIENKEGNEKIEHERNAGSDNNQQSAEETTTTTQEGEIEEESLRIAQVKKQEGEDSFLQRWFSRTSD